jgi:predicted HAD superfamily Cof-like phosphohydrolase
MSYLKSVNAFHAAFDYMQPSPTKSDISDKETARLRLALIYEETKELMEGLDCDDKIETLDALCDLQYVITGAIIAFGYGHVFGRAFNRVHQANMAKLWNAKEVESHTGDYAFKPSPSVPNRWIASRPDGKIMKPPSWVKPDLSGFI